MVSSPFWFGCLHPWKSIQSFSDHCYLMIKPFYPYGSDIFLDDSAPINRTKVLPEWLDKNDVSPKLFTRSSADAFGCLRWCSLLMYSFRAEDLLADHHTLQRLMLCFNLSAICAYIITQGTHSTHRIFKKKSVTMETDGCSSHTSPCWGI